MKHRQFIFSISLLLFIIINSRSAVAQNQGNFWCFGDSAGIDFNASPTPILTSLDSRGSCVSIADSMGQLLFYANTRASTVGNTTLIWNKNNQLMQNGDSVVGEGWYNELLIIPSPVSNGHYFLFSIGITGSSQTGIYFSEIDINLNGGLGEIIQKNIQLQSFPAVDCIAAIKHGNGRDWWVFFKKDDGFMGNFNNDFYEYLITPTGISTAIIQSVGTLYSGGFGKLCVNKLGNKIAFVNTYGLVEIYNFNRCTGIIDSVVTIEQQSSAPPYLGCWECAFSPNGNFLYVTTNDTLTLLLQYNLSDVNPSSTKDTLWFTNFPKYTGGAIRRAPDNKLYLSCAYYDGMNWNYPYPDSVYNMYNMNLGVVNFPDSLGAACVFQPYSFYLGGKRTYWGLPNNPDYDLGALTGSICDSLTSSIQDLSVQNEIHIFPNPFFNKIAFQYPFNSNFQIKNVSVINQLGEKVYSKKIASPLYEIDLSFLQQGIYFISIQTNKGLKIHKLVKL